MAPQTFTRRNEAQSMARGVDRQPIRGGIRKRNSGPVRVDKDGDLEMNDGESKGRGGRRIGARGGRGAQDRIGPGVTVNNARINRRLPRVSQDLKQYPRSDRRIQTGARYDSRGSRARPLPRERELSPSGLEQLIVRGFDNIGVPPHTILTRLIGILERRVSPQNGLARDVVRIRKVCLTLCFPVHGWHRNFGLSGPLSFQAKLSERRPRYSSLAMTTFGLHATSRFIYLANVV